MNFYVFKGVPKIPAEKCPAFSLIIDEWNDFGIVCQFLLTFHDQNGEKHTIGSTKILHLDDDTTKLPEVFSSLDSEYISLGQEIQFYENLNKNCDADSVQKALEALRDIAWRTALAEPFETQSSFRNALLRFNEAQKALRFGQDIVLGNGIDERYQFAYDITIPGASAPTKVHFDFDKDDDLPGRIFGIIGRNATGKTQYLSKLAGDLVRLQRVSQKRVEESEDVFSPQRPLFNRVITVSYSVFDKFARPKSENISYVYCGIRDKRGGVSKKHLLETYQGNLKRIREMSNETIWLKLMTEIMDEQSDELEKQLARVILGNSVSEESWATLSSGQAILANFITSLVAWMEPNSIVLFDEPETHLHPNAVASLFNVFNKLLEKFDSYAIVATHSPLVIQEIPRKRVVCFLREGVYTTARKLEVESFGENVSELTRHVFETIEIPSFYRRKLKKLTKLMSLDEVEELFDGKLSMNAMSFLLSQYMEGDDETTN